MIARMRWALVFAALAVVCPRGLGDDATTEAGPKAAEFDRLYGEWTGILEQLRQLRMEYHNAMLAGQGLLEDLDARYGKLVEQAEAMQPGLLKAAEAAYVEDPAIRSYATQFLVATAYTACFDGAYEESFRLAKLLMDHGFDQKNILGWCGVAAYAAGDFERAEKWLRAAKEANVLARSGMRWEQMGSAALRACPACQKAWKKEEVIREAETKAGQSPKTWLPRVLLRTTKGEIEVELFENEAPGTVANFVGLVEKGMYDKFAFYRVDPFGAETGALIARDKNPWFFRLLGCDQPSRAHFRGSLTTAAPVDAQGNGSSQFQILLLPQPSLDGKRTCFGRVVKGIEVVARLQQITPEQFDSVKPDGILEAKVLRKRDHPYEAKLPLRPEPEAEGGPTPEPKPAPQPESKPLPKS